MAACWTAGDAVCNSSEWKRPAAVLLPRRVYVWSVGYGSVGSGKALLRGL